MRELSITHAVIAAVAAVLAVLAVWADRRRMRRRDPDRVGFMPWTAVFFLAFFVAVVLTGLAAREWFAG